MEILDDYLNLQEKVLDYFGCSLFFITHDVIDPFLDKRKHYWILHPTEDGGGMVYDTDEAPITLEFLKDNYVGSSRIIPRQHRGVFRGEKYTMIITECIPGRFETAFSIYDNSKQMFSYTPELLAALHERRF